MKFSIFASKTTGTSSKELRRFDTPDEYHGKELAAAYTWELRRQGWTINEVCQTDTDGLPTRKRAKK